ncbi:MAG: histidine phosphatase family protein [Peptoniphilus sp.]|nr:histidine phosphatase family protein [Peptoniphilus sp.]MDD7362777.1 histidine phosphatase family protein [Bacillota bacterium]MDY6044031.1 histidine phosphatase family protein [Peptoniphilus sp.]
MYLYILRHAETEWNVEDRIQGRMDSPITKKGYAEIARMRQTLASIPLDVCYTSDLTRAKRTAQNLINTKNLPIIEIEALRELPLGSWEGALFKEVRDDPLFEVYFQRPDEFQLPGKENFHDLYRHIEEFIRMLERCDHKHVLIVAHGVSIRALLNVLEGIPVRQFWHRPVARNMGLSIAKYDGASWLVLRRADKKDGLSY